MKTRQSLVNAPPYSVDLADVERHRDAILAIWQHAGEGAPQADKLDRYYLRNPAGPPIIFLLWSDTDQRYVGVLCAAPRFFVSGSIRLVGMVFADFVVEPSHRTLGPSVLMLRHAKEYLLQRVDFIYGFMNPLAAMVGKRIGLTFPNPLQQLVFPLSIQHHVGKRLGGRVGISAGKILHFPFLGLISIMSGIFGAVFEKEITISPKISDLRKLSAARNEKIIGQRDESFINWRLNEYPKERYRNFCIEDKKGNLVGYIVYYLANGEKRAHIVDIFAFNSVALLALITRFCREMMKKDLISVQLALLTDCEESMLIRKLGFQRAGSLAFFCDWADKHASSFAKKPIYVTPADNDV